LIFKSNSWPNRITSAFLDCCANKGENKTKKAKSAKEAEREWGMGNEEWGMGMGKKFPSSHSPLPTPYSLFAFSLHSVA
jgi:hypothetical protein